MRTKNSSLFEHCRFLAHLQSNRLRGRYPVTEVEQTCSLRARNDADDPKQTSRRDGRFPTKCLHGLHIFTYQVPRCDIILAKMYGKDDGMRAAENDQLFERLWSGDAAMEEWTTSVAAP